MAAIGDGTGTPGALTAALREAEHQRTAVLAQLAEIATLAHVADLDSPQLRRLLWSIVSTWRTALQKNVPSARQILRKLLVGRLRFTPAGHAGFVFEGEGRLDPLLAGTIPVPKALVPPGWFGRDRTLTGTIRAA